MNFGDLFDSPWKILIVAVVLIVLFGSKKLPDAARSLGKSMRILKTEVQDLHHEDKDEAEKQAAAMPAPAITAPPSQQQVDLLQQQIRDLQAKQSAAAEAAKVSGAPVSETQHTQAG
jgi:sec-independent protein translocase protein TatA